MAFHNVLKGRVKPTAANSALPRALLLPLRSSTQAGGKDRDGSMKGTAHGHTCETQTAHKVLGWGLEDLASMIMGKLLHYRKLSPLPSNSEHRLTTTNTINLPFAPQSQRAQSILSKINSK